MTAIDSAALKSFISQHGIDSSFKSYLNDYRSSDLSLENMSLEMVMARTFTINA